MFRIFFGVLFSLILHLGELLSVDGSNELESVHVSVLPSILHLGVLQHDGPDDPDVGINLLLSLSHVVLPEEVIWFENWVNLKIQSLAHSKQNVPER